MIINHNMNALNAHRNMGVNNTNAGKSMEKLSSGLRINRAGDDAAGLAISEKMRGQIRGLEQSSRNAADGISMIQTAEGALNETTNILQRMRELAVQGANETNTGSDRAKISEELTQLHEEIDRIAESTQFNGKDLLNGANTVRVEKGHTLTEESAKISKVEIQDGFDFDDFTGTDLKIKTTAKAQNAGANSSKIELDNNPKYGIAIDKIEDDGKIKEGSVITITDSNGKSMKLTVKAEIDASTTAQKIGTKKETETAISGKEISLQVGANTSDSQTLKVKIENVSTKSLGLDGDTITKMAKEGTKGTTAANDMIKSLDKALERVNTSRANLGAMQNRLEYTANNLTTSTENLTAAESRIRDVDVAKEMVTLSKLNILNQASQAMVSQAKQQPESVSQLLR